MFVKYLPLSLILISCTYAADQVPAPQKPDTQAASKADDSAPVSKAESKSWHPRIHFGGLMVGAGYSRFSGGYPYYGYGYPGYWDYDPFLWSSFYHPGYYSGFAYGPNMGDVKLQIADKTAMVYLDGALAGRVDQLKNMWLEPGTYHLEVRDSTKRLTQKIYVLSGKTLKVTPDMMTREALP